MWLVGRDRGEMVVAYSCLPASCDGATYVLGTAEVINKFDVQCKTSWGASFTGKARNVSSQTGASALRFS